MQENIAMENYKLIPENPEGNLEKGKSRGIWKNVLMTLAGLVAIGQVLTTPVYAQGMSDLFIPLVTTSENGHNPKVNSVVPNGEGETKINKNLFLPVLERAEEQEPPVAVKCEAIVKPKDVLADVLGLSQPNGLEFRVVVEPFGKEWVDQDPACAIYEEHEKDIRIDTTKTGLICKYWESPGVGEIPAICSFTRRYMPREDYEYDVVHIDNPEIQNPDIKGFSVTVVDPEAYIPDDDISTQNSDQPILSFPYDSRISVTRN